MGKQNTKWEGIKGVELTEQKVKWSVWSIDRIREDEDGDGEWWVMIKEEKWKIERGRQDDLVKEDENGFVLIVLEEKETDEWL